MSAAPNTFPGMDAFTGFWTDFMNKMNAAGVPTPPAGSDVANQVRRAFFDAMARHAEEYMRSDQFLAAMKQGMDNALALQQNMNQFLQRGMAGAQMPSRVDTDHLVVLIRGMEDRLLNKLEDLQSRVERLEAGTASGGKKRA